MFRQNEHPTRSSLRPWHVHLVDDAVLPPQAVPSVTLPYTFPAGRPVVVGDDSDSDDAVRNAFYALGSRVKTVPPNPRTTAESGTDSDRSESDQSSGTDSADEDPQDIAHPLRTVIQGDGGRIPLAPHFLWDMTFSAHVGLCVWGDFLCAMCLGLLGAFLEGCPPFPYAMGRWWSGPGPRGPGTWGPGPRGRRPGPRCPAPGPGAPRPPP